VGGILPAATQAVRNHFPFHLRPLAIAIIFCCGQAALPIAPFISLLSNGAAGWRTTLALTCIPSAIAAVLCIFLSPTRPRSERTALFSSAGAAAVAMLSLGLFLGSPVQSFSSTWLSSYLRDMFHVGLERFGVASLTITIAGAAGALLIGLAAHQIMRTGITASRTRAALLTLCGCLLVAVGLTRYAGTAAVTVGLLSFVSAAYLGWSVLLYTAVADTMPERGVAVGAAIGGFFANLSAVTAPVIIANSARSGNYQSALTVLAILAAIGALTVGILSWLVHQEPLPAGS
jgi:predicted MFS family arabinose efflux permease